jgi:hypothetical protein
LSSYLYIPDSQLVKYQSEPKIWWPNQNLRVKPQYVSYIRSFHTGGKIVFSRQKGQIGCPFAVSAMCGGEGMVRCDDAGTAELSPTRGAASLDEGDHVGELVLLGHATVYDPSIGLKIKTCRVYSHYILNIFKH